MIVDTTVSFQEKRIQMAGRLAAAVERKREKKKINNAFRLGGGGDYVTFPILTTAEDRMQNLGGDVFQAAIQRRKDREAKKEELGNRIRIRTASDCIVLELNGRARLECEAQESFARLIDSIERFGMYLKQVRASNCNQSVVVL